jgi:DDE superfamily endonuclease
MARLHGRSAYGQRCVAALLHGHWKTMTFVGALRVTGMTAPMVLDGPMDGAAFEAYVIQVLVPTLRPGCIVVMDNLAAHKRSEIAMQSGPRAPGSSICRPIRPTSIRSKWPSPSSKPPCAKRPPDHSKP